MNKRRLGNTGALVSEVGLGTWQLGTRWGDEFNAKEARSILEAAYENGINFIDTADTYIAGNSEKAIGEFIKGKDDIFVVTKCGSKIPRPRTADDYKPDLLESFIDDSLKRLGVEKLDMVLLHSPPPDVYERDDIFETMDKIKAKGKIAAYGVSAETVATALKAMDYNISAIEIIFNMFRLKPAEELFGAAKKNDIGIITRVPLASGILTGKFTKDTTFGEGDHRSFNRDGARFDKGETFSGVDYELGLQAAEELKALFGTDELAPYALKWILMHDAVSAVIPGASKTSQVISNVKAADMRDLTADEMAGVQAIYDKYIRASVHDNW